MQIPFAKSIHSILLLASFIANELSQELPYLAAGLDGACRADDHEAAAGILGTEDHALALVGDEAYLLTHEFLGLIPLGDTADDGTSSHAVVDGELQQFVGLLHLFTSYNGAHADI